jgi:hypothetical protein
LRLENDKFIVENGGKGTLYLIFEKDNDGYQSCDTINNFFKIERADV